VYHQVDAAAEHRSLRDTPSRTCSVRMSPSSSLSRTCGPNSPVLNPVDYAICRACMSKSTTARSSTPLISWSRRSYWSGADCHRASLITASVNGDVVCSVSWQTHSTGFSLTVLAVISSLLQTYFLDYITTFSWEHQPASDL